MKKCNLLLFIFLSATLNSFAKKVKFAVDLSNQTVSPNGVHVTGDFQTLAGFPGGDWQSNTTPLTQEGSSDIYSIVVDLPAFAKYEYKFVNGDQFYDSEFVPVESRVGFNFNDNRWIYVDSLSNDTSFVGAILFGENAPVGLNLVRFTVNMQGFSVAASGVHVAGSFQGWDPATTILCNLDASYYDLIVYLPNGTYDYRFYNGNTLSGGEVVNGICSVSGNRQASVSGHTVLPAVCFGSCSDCFTGIDESLLTQNFLTLAPNPAVDMSILTFTNSVDRSIQVFDMEGRLLREYSRLADDIFIIKRGDLKSGVYQVRVQSAGLPPENRKLIFN